MSELLSRFYNYHEYRNPYDDSVIITHHPNPYPNQNIAYEGISTRVVRIPRLPNTDYPQFSTDIPGFEEGAIKYIRQKERNNNNDDDGDCDCDCDSDSDCDCDYGYGYEARNEIFRPTSTYMSQKFGKGSISPLSNYITKEEFTEFVTFINDIFKSMYAASNETMLWMIFNMLLFEIPNLIYHILLPSSDPGSKLDHYIKVKNDFYKSQGIDIRIINPKESGFLSLDIALVERKEINRERKQI